MQHSTAKGQTIKDFRQNKASGASSRLKKDLKHSSSKNLKNIKGVGAKGQDTGEKIKVKQVRSPEAVGVRDCQNDYGVNPYYPRYKVKTSQRKQTQTDDNDYYKTFSSSRDGLSTSQFDTMIQKGSKVHPQETYYQEATFQKIKLPNKRGVINAQGKFINAAKSQNKKHSFQNHSTSKHSFSLNFTARESSRYSKKGGKSKSKSKQLQKQRQREYLLKARSMDKGHSKEHHSYYERTRREQKSMKKKKKSVSKPKELNVIEHVHSNTMSIGTETMEVSSLLPLTQDSHFVDSVKDEIAKDIVSSKSLVSKNKLSTLAIKERSKCIHLLSRICGTMAMKRDSFSLAVCYLDLYISQFPYSSMKLVSLGALTLALKMDDAEMLSKFCYHYLYNPEKTVKKHRSNKYFKNKTKKEQPNTREQNKQIRLKLSTIISTKISEDKKQLKQDFSIEEVLDFETQIMIKLGFKLTFKTLTYWVDLLSALWDSYMFQFSPKHLETLGFRSSKQLRNFSYLVQLVELESLSMEAYHHCKVSVVLGAMYLVCRMALQEEKEGTPWDQLCRYYRVSLSKSTNLIFCDGVGINVLFGDFLTLFDLNMSNLIECVQHFSRWLQPSTLQIWTYRRGEALNREDSLSTYRHNDELYRCQRG